MTTARFRRVGSALQPRLETPDDLFALLDVDAAHWVATSAPTATLQADPDLLSLLDADGDKRITVGDVKREIAALRGLLSDPTGVGDARAQLALAAVNEASEEGARCLRAARKVIARVGAAGDSSVSLEQVRAVEAEELAKGLSEAGLVLPSAAEDPALRALLEDALATVGGQAHPAGEQAVSLDDLKRLFAEVEAWLSWSERPAASPELMPYGADSDEVSALVAALEPKLTQHFTLCDTLRLSPALAARLWPATEDLDLSDAAQASAWLDAAPVARPRPDGLLPAEDIANPRFAPLFTRLRVLLPSLAEPLDAPAWSALVASLGPHRAWRAEAPAVQVQGLPAERLARYRADVALREAAVALLETSHGEAVVMDNLRLLEALLLRQRGLLAFANSFAAFPDLYDPEARALFEEGTLTLDGRAFTLAVRVLDRARHARFAQASRLFVLIVELSDLQGTPLFEVAVPVTSGNRGTLQEGKWGVFRTTEDEELHARVVAIVENPISFFEAMLQPFQRLGRAAADRVEKLGQERTRALEAEAAHTTGALLEPPIPSEGAPTPAPPAPKAAAAPKAAVPTGSAMASGSIAVAALGSSLAFITQTLESVSWATMLGTALALLLAVLIPTLLLAGWRLTHRDLSPFLEGSGWGLNASMRLTRAQARAFTHRPAYPAGAEGVPVHRRWPWLIGVVVVLGVAAWLFKTYGGVL